MASRPGEPIGPGGRPGAAVGVVGGVHLEVPAADVPVPAPVLLEGVDDGGVGLEEHPLLEAVQEDGGDPRALLDGGGLELHERGQDDDLAARVELLLRRCGPARARRPRGSAAAMRRTRARAGSGAERERRRCRGRGSPRDRWRRGRGRGWAPGRGPQRGTPRRRGPAWPTSAAVSSRVRPSGMVTSWRTTSPRARTSTISSSERGPSRAYSPALSWPPTPRDADEGGRARGCRTRPRASSLRPIASALAPGGTTSFTGGAPSASFGRRVSCRQASQAPAASASEADAASREADAGAQRRTRACTPASFTRPSPGSAPRLRASR